MIKTISHRYVSCWLDMKNFHDANHTSQHIWCCVWKTICTIFFSLENAKKKFKKRIFCTRTLLLCYDFFITMQTIRRNTHGVTYENYFFMEKFQT